MKNYIAIITILLFAQFSHAQDKHYEKLWKQVQTFETDNLPKSALKVVDQIEALAIKENNKPQQIKVLLFKSKFALILEEDAQLKIITDFKTAISQNEAPVKNVLDRKSTRLNSSHVKISYAVFCLKKKKKINKQQ